MKKIIIRILIIISIFIALTFVSVFFLMKSDKILVSFNIKYVNHIHNSFELSFDKVGAAKYYRVELTDTEANVIYFFNTEDTYNKFGYYKTETISIVYDGVNAKDKMSSVMKKLRKENIFDEEEVIDYLNKKDDLKTDCLKFIMHDNEYFMVRPSGTEPKLKIYFIVNDKNEEKAENRLNKLINKVNKVLN